VIPSHSGDNTDQTTCCQKILFAKRFFWGEKQLGGYFLDEKQLEVLGSVPKQSRERNLQNLLHFCRNKMSKPTPGDPAEHVPAGHVSGRLPWVVG
jgi:hypothetical protein